MLTVAQYHPVIFRLDPHVYSKIIEEIVCISYVKTSLTVRVYGIASAAHYGLWFCLCDREFS